MGNRFAHLIPNEQQPAAPQKNRFAHLIPAQQPTQPASKPVQAAPELSTRQRHGTGMHLLRQFGLTGRHALEGVAQAAEIVTEPARYVTDRVFGWTGQSLPLSELARRGADAIGLPKPEDATERVVGDAARLGFGAMVPMGAANKFAPLAKSGVARSIVAGVAENPAAQIGGGVGSGLASGAAREAGADKGVQAVAGVIGGIGGGMAGNRAMKIVGRPSEYIANKFGVEPLPQTLKPRQMSNDTLSQVLRSKISITGGDWDKIPKQVQQSIIADVRKANNLDNLDAQAMRRLADFRALGVTPTRGTVTLDPVQITREKNLAKAGANSGLVNTHGMAQVENANNNRLVQLLQGVEGNGETDATAAGNAVLNSILGKRDTLRGAEDAAWEAAKASPGYTRPIDSGVLGDINQALGDSAMMPFMDARISSYIKALQENPEQWTPAAYRNLQSMLAKAANAGGNEGYAAGVARRALENAQMRAGGAQFVSDGLPITQRAADIIRTADDNAGRTVDLIDNARRATRQAYEFEGSSNVVKAALADGADPTSLAKRFVINGNDTEAATVLQNLSPQGRQVVRNAIATHIKKKALGGAADEVGNVSQKALNSTINGIGKNKLGLFFTPEEMEQLSRIGRVASYVQVQPTGSAVNNSNSGAMVVGKAIDLLGGLTSKIPLLNINQQVDSLINVGRTRTALDATKGIYTMPQNRFGLLPSAARGGLVGGLLVAPSDREDDRKRK